MNKLLSCRYNMDTNRVEARFEDGTTLAIDCIAVENEYGNTPAQRAELDWLFYNKPLEYAQLVLGGGMSTILPLAVTTADWKIKSSSSKSPVFHNVLRHVENRGFSLLRQLFAHFL